MSESNYELPIEKPVLYALASLCVATYVNAGVPEAEIPAEVKRKQQRFLHLMGWMGGRIGSTWRKMTFVPRKLVGFFKSKPPKEISDKITADTRNQILEKFEEPFKRLALKMPFPGDVLPINHRYMKAGEARLGGFAIATRDCIAIAFRGTAYSEEWVANISYGVPAVKNGRHVFGVVTMSILPILKKTKLLEKVFDLKTAKLLNAGYLEHVDGMVAHTKMFLDGVIKSEQADPSLKSRPLYFTGHSLGGAAAIIVSREVLEDKKRDYKSWFASRMKTVTFGAPPISARPIVANPKDPPIYNLLRRGDIVPGVSIDVLGIPLVNKVIGQLPGTPYHCGDHYYIHDDGKNISVKHYAYRRRKVFRSTGGQFCLGMLRLRPFSLTMQCHYMVEYAKDLECLAFPADCRRRKK